MSIRKTEILTDAISSLHKFYSPESLAYKLKNPLMLKSFARSGKHSGTEDGYRVFDSLLAGYKAAIYDVEKKVSGSSNCGLRPEDKLRNLLKVYGIAQEQEMLTVVYFLRKALADKNIDQYTPLSYFLEA
jgi:hypothetical protein